MVSRRTSPPRTRDQAALLRAIIDHPDEDAPRLVYADLLDDLGGESNTARAEFIRLQCVSARYAPWEPVAEIPGARRLAARLLRRYWGEWTAGVSGTGVSHVDFVRGFPETVTITAAAFIRRGGAIRAAVPLRRLELRHLAGRCARLAACRHLHALRELTVDDAEAGDHDVAELVEAAGVDPSARYAALESLAFPSNHLGPVAFAALAGCGGMPRLRSLTVSNAYDFKDAEAEPLANAKGFGRLADLTFTEARVRGRGLAALLSSDRLAASWRAMAVETIPTEPALGGRVQRRSRGACEHPEHRVDSPTNHQNIFPARRKLPSRPPNSVAQSHESRRRNRGRPSEGARCRPGPGQDGVRPRLDTRGVHEVHSPLPPDDEQAGRANRRGSG
jgi:uncharacterized protein (TIGR02996 family)